MTIVFEVSENIKHKMIEYYKDKCKPIAPPYSIFQAVEADTVITLYQSGKAMFQGMSADIDANIWRDLEKHFNDRDIDTRSTEEKKKDRDYTYYYFSAIGSDEVGKGDYLLPLVVTAAFVNKDNIEYLEKLKVQDSKKMTDAKILSVAPYIIKKIPYESIILTNEEFNKYHDENMNMNQINAILHNKMLYKLKNRNMPYQKIIVDQFTPPRAYYGYLKGTDELVKNITFVTKAEDKNLAVACASIISRYIFLKEIEKLNKIYKMDFPKGAGPKVDEFGKEFIQKYSKEELKKVAKISFGNTDKILKKS